MGFQTKFVFALVLVSSISTRCEDLDDDMVGMMTTLEPIDTADDLKSEDLETFSTSANQVNCSQFGSCDLCSQNNCSWTMCSDLIDYYGQCSNSVGQNCTLSSCVHDACKNATDCDQCGTIDDCDWVQCEGSEEGPYCGLAVELCTVVACNATVLTTTVSPNETTTTISPNDTTTTISPNDTTTTISPNDTTTTISPNDTTTTISPNDTTTTISPETTTLTPAPDTTTEAPTTAVPSPTTTPGPAPAPAPQSGGFSAGSFFGGIILTLALIGVGLGGYKFYKTRYDVNYRTL